MFNRVAECFRVSLLAVTFLALGAVPAMATPIVVPAVFADELKVDIPAPPVDFAGPVFLDFDISGVDPGELVQVHGAHLIGGILINFDLFEDVGGIYVPSSPVGYSVLPQLLITQPSAVNTVNDGVASIFLFLTGPGGATAEFNSLTISGQTVGRGQYSVTVGAAAPEPASLLLLATGVSWLAAARRRKARLAARNR